ncbi:hypothetical protein [Sphingobium sp. Z007]|uniref:hypothetical protein n=1 Tax=Sphingobium sp. Z007 TaxID=627495 RepID=UPI000B49E291|nr:hypothetical protein [Sphingobium sp. Z007]
MFATIGLVTAAVLLAGAATADPPPPHALIESVRAQLFYELSGTLSGNIASPPSRFSGWNTVIGEGEAKEAAQDLLVTVRVKGNGADGFLTETPLVITARNSAGKLLGSRSVTGILVPYEGSVATALWINNATCAGKLTIEAKLGKQVKTATVALDCGE